MLTVDKEWSSCCSVVTSGCIGFCRLFVSFDKKQQPRSKTLRHGKRKCLLNYLFCHGLRERTKRHTKNWVLPLGLSLKFVGRLVGLGGHFMPRRSVLVIKLRRKQSKDISHQSDKDPRAPRCCICGELGREEFVRNKVEWTWKVEIKYTVKLNTQWNPRQQVKHARLLCFSVVLGTNGRLSYSPILTYNNNNNNNNNNVHFCVPILYTR